MSELLHIEAESLTKHYTLTDGTLKHAVDGISFSITEGERLGIIGRNGAGKTTLLQMVAGIGAASAGNLRINGKVTAVFTLGLGLRDDLTGRDNIYIDGELHGRSHQQTDALMQDIIDFAELGAFIDRPVRTYSTGMKARLAFSMITHIDPEILIIDEALSVGDAAFAAKASAKMRELAARGRILIVVSHSMGAITDMCTRCLWIDEGHIRMDGTPAEVTRAYIDEVREADEHLLMERFRHILINESLCDGWDVGALRFRTPVHHTALSVLQTGEPTELQLSFSTPPHAVCRAVIEFFRLDAVRVCISESGPMQADSHGAIERIAGLGTLPLNHGLYAVRVALFDGDTLCARNTVCIEVINPTPPRGGRPVLITPIHVQSEAIAS